MVVLSLGCALESPRVISETSMLWPHQRPKKQCLWKEGTQTSVFFKTIQWFQWAAKARTEISSQWSVLLATLFLFWQAPIYPTGPGHIASPPGISKALCLWGSIPHHCFSLHPHHFKIHLTATPAPTMASRLSSSGHSGSSPQRWDSTVPCSCGYITIDI